MEITSCSRRWETKALTVDHMPRRPNADTETASRTKQETFRLAHLGAEEVEEYSAGFRATRAAASRRKALAMRIIQKMRLTLGPTAPEDPDRRCISLQPIFVDGGHFRLFVFDRSTFTVYIIEPFKRRRNQFLHDNKLLDGLFRKHISVVGEAPQWKRKALALGVQHDGYQCGIWVSLLSIVTVRLIAQRCDITDANIESGVLSLKVPQNSLRPPPPARITRASRSRPPAPITRADRFLQKVAQWHQWREYIMSIADKPAPQYPYLLPSTITI